MSKNPKSLSKFFKITILSTITGIGIFSLLIYQKTTKLNSLLYQQSTITKLALDNSQVKIAFTQISSNLSLKNAQPTNYEVLNSQISSTNDNLTSLQNDKKIISSPITNYITQNQQILNSYQSLLDEYKQMDTYLSPIFSYSITDGIGSLDPQNDSEQIIEISAQLTNALSDISEKYPQQNIQTPIKNISNTLKSLQESPKIDFDTKITSLNSEFVNLKVALLEIKQSFFKRVDVIETLTNHTQLINNYQEALSTLDNQITSL